MAQHVPPPEQVAPSRTSDDAPPPAEARVWYGWQTLASDGAAGGLFLAAVADHGKTALYGVSGITYVLGAPIVHLAHGQWEMSLASLGVRTVTPLLGAAIGNHYDNCQAASVTGSSRGACSSKWEVTGVAVGGLAAALLDGLLLAYEPSRRTSASDGYHATAPLDRIRWPSVTPLQNGVLLGWSTNF
jgi:hypothetical protein